ncbi:11840_t:CDS:2 [Diversispora eburnea]|uniref:11840_t:CDS:1 n=1 Tax=Diversispora eburnea TaxID=1213867 RepID=A0A9N9CX77_9GLOM|nr:11840_t:CDS:2 [Diversispora eburnea]
MSGSSFTRSRRTDVDYDITFKSVNTEAEKFNPLDMEAEMDIRSFEIQDNQNTVKDLKKNKKNEWKEVKKHKGKYAKKPDIIKKPNEEEDNKSITSYNSKDDYQLAWRKTLNIPKYKIWTSAHKIFDQIADNFKSYGEFVARVIGPSYNMTARELFLQVVKLGAKTYYFPHTRNNRKKNEAIISFTLKEEYDNVIEFKWETANYRLLISKLKPTIDTKPQIILQLPIQGRLKIENSKLRLLKK